MTSTNVSTSEVATFTTCKQRWKYAHHPSYNLEPATLGVALTRGVVGHEALEIYYRAIMHGDSHEKASSEAEQFLIKRTLNEVQVGDAEKAKMLSYTAVLVKQYFQDNLHLLKEYKVVGVEEVFIFPLTSTINFAGRVDVVFESRFGNYKGERFPFDHKFCYNFWSENSIKLNAQIPNYVAALRMNGFHSRKGFINMLRYRENAVDKFLQEEVPTNSTLRSTFLDNHTKVAEEIVELKKLPTVSLEDGITRSVSKFNCEYCPFAELCIAEASGKDVTLKIKANYKPNSYGYDSELDID